MPLKPAALGLAAMALAAGCAVGPDFKRPPPDVPGVFLNAPAGSGTPGTPDRWWTQFQDPLLDRLIDGALRQNLDVAQALARLRQARAQARVADAGTYPSVAADAGITRSRTSANGPIPIGRLPGASITNTTYAGGFDARWELDLFGHERRTAEAAAAHGDAQAASVRAATLSMAAELARDYFDYRGVQAQIAVLDSSIRDADQSLELTRQRLKAGDAAEVDVARARNELLALQSQRPALAAALGGDEYQLELLVGRPPGVLAGALSAAVALPAAGPPPAGLPSLVLERRPDVAEAEAQLHAATAEVGIAVSNQFPRFALVGSYGDQAIHAGDFLDAASRYWSLGPSLTLPLFQGGALAAQVDAQKAAQETALAGYRRAVLAALAETETAFLRDAQAREVTAQRREQLSAAQSILETQQQRYAAGDIALIDLLDAQRQRNDVQGAEIQARMQACRERIALFKALGGGWESIPAGG